MKIAITLGVDGAGKIKLMSGPDVPRNQQRIAFKLAKADRLASSGLTAMIFADAPHVIRAPQPPAPAQEASGKGKGK